jgi:hypothetical protein
MDAPGAQQMVGMHGRGGGAGYPPPQQAMSYGAPQGGYPPQPQYYAQQQQPQAYGYPAQQQQPQYYAQQQPQQQMYYAPQQVGPGGPAYANPMYAAPSAQQQHMR